MEIIELDIKILRKLLNSKLFLDKFPIIDLVWVNKSGNRIDVVLSIKPIKDTKEYFSMRNDILRYIWKISHSAGVQTYYNVYP
jgi:hypothetical protein